MNSYGMVIVGAGEAGARAAIELRNQGWKGSIAMIGEESKAPYERPPLSKSIMTSDIEPTPSFILDNEKLFELNIQWFSGIRIVRINRCNHTVSLENGQEIKYERLLLATGAKPRKLSLEGSDTSGVLYLRSFSDAMKIRPLLQSGKHIVVIGAGFIGLELAASAREKGCLVTVVEAGPRILMRGVPEEIALSVESRHRAAGVNFKLGARINRIDSSLDMGNNLIMLSDGTMIRCDVIIAGIGAIPETELAAVSGLRIENGIWVDETLATSDADIYAAGDCCSFPHIMYEGKRIRLESWRNAQDQGIHAARNMIGGSESYTAVPWFWSDQYELTLQVVGLPDVATITVNREPGDGNQIYMHLAADHRLVAASGIGPSIAKEIRIAEMLIERKAKLDPDVLSRPDLKLKTLLQS